MEFTVDRDGFKLYCVLEKPDLEKCPVVIMHHGSTMLISAHSMTPLLKE